jgi:arylsulfatase A-like enzyme
LRSTPLVALLSLLVASWPTSGNAAPAPNVIVILADDAGWGDFSFVGNTNLATPAIDSLARDGAVFERFFVQPVCAPTRAELLTGRYHPRSGVRGVSLGQERMAADERTLAEIFGDAGYATGCFGKWHNGTQWPHHPRARGFDTFYGFTEGHWNAYHDAELEHDGRFVRGSGYIADDLTGRAVDFIGDRARERRPFFCYLALNTPHSPMDVPDDDWARFREAPIGLRGPKGEEEDVTFTRAALAMVENLDRNVGRLLAAVAAAGVADDTILVFFSDNGPNSPRWCGGFRGHKGSTDEGGVRSVCCVRFPARIRPGTRVPAIAAAIDLLPTLAGLAGVAVGATKPLDGLDLSPVLVAGPAAAQVAAQAAARSLAASFGGRVSIRSQTHRLDDKGRLYDIDADPGHTHDLAAEFPDEASRLRETAARWRRDVLEAAPKPREERFPVGAPGAPLTELPARDGLPHGGVARSSPAPNASFFNNWTSVADSITWTVDVLTAGRYEATLWYTCPAADAGSTVRLACGTSSTQATITPAWDPPPSRNRDRVPRRGEGIDKVFRPLSLGTIDLAAGPTTLDLRATRIPGQTVADVRRLVLVPVAAEGATQRKAPYDRDSARNAP